MIHNNCKKGIILIFVISILAVLVAIAVLGYNLATTTKSLSIVAINKVKAEFAAESGVRYSLSNVFRPGQNWVYYGEDLNKNYQLDEGEDFNRNSILDTQSAPLDGKHMPSLHKATIVLKDGKTIHYSGDLPDTHEHKIIFILKIVDESNKVYAAPLNEVKIRFIRNLCEILNIKLSEHFSNFEELKSNLPYKDFLKLSNYVSFAKGALQKMVFPSSGLKEGSTILTRLQLLPTTFKEYELELLNVNSAPPEVIKADLMNLEAIYFKEDEASYKLNFSPKDIGVWDYWKIIREKSFLIEKIMNLGRTDKGPIKLGEMKKYAIAPSSVETITQKIIERRIKSNFSSYLDLYDFLSTIVNEKLISELDRDIVFANLHPNPPSSIFTQFSNFLLKINKENILNPTIPFAFTPQGTFSIESLGMVIDVKNQKVIAQDTVKASAKLQDLLSFRTYNDFNGFSFKGLDIYPFSKEFSKKMKVDLNSFIGLKFYEAPQDNDTIFYASNTKPKSIEVDNEELLDFVPNIYKGYRPFFTTEGIYSGQGHFLKIPASVVNMVDLKDIAQGMLDCGKLNELFKINLGKGCGQGIKGSISFLYKPLFDTVNLKKARMIFSLNNFKNNKVSALNVLPYVSRKFWADYFPVMENLSVGAPAWIWQSYRVGFYFVATTKKPEQKEIIEQGKWTHFKLVFDTSNYIDVSKGARIYVNGEDVSRHMGFTTTVGLRGGIFGVPDYFTNNYLRFGESYKENAWNFPQDGLYNKIKVSKNIDAPSWEELKIMDDKEKLEIVFPEFSQKTFFSSIYVENYSNLFISVIILNKKGEITHISNGRDIVIINKDIFPDDKLKIVVTSQPDEFPIITGIIVGTLKTSAEFIEFSRPQE